MSTVLRGARRNRSRVRTSDEDVPRPPCATCGAGASCVMSVEVQDLVLERDSGVRSVPYWNKSYKGTVASIEVRLCAGCLQKNVRLTTQVAVEVVKKAPKETRGFGNEEGDT